MQTQFTATLDKIEGEYVLLHHGNRNILFPKTDLPGDIAEGMTVTVTAVTEESTKKSRLAKAEETINDLLNETLGSPGTTPSTLDDYESLEEDHLQQILLQIQELNKNLRNK